MLDLPAAIILGIICGLLGALFIYISVSLGIQRKKYITNNFRKIFECAAFGFVTASCFYGVVVLRKNNCKLREGTVADQEEEFAFTCPEGYYNPLATLILNTEGGTIRQFFRYPLLIANEI